MFKGYTATYTVPRIEKPRAAEPAGVTATN